MERWCSGSTSAFQADNAGSNPVCSSSGDVANLRHGDLPFLPKADSWQRPPAGLSHTGGYTARLGRPGLLHLLSQEAGSIPARATIGRKAGHIYSKSIGKEDNSWSLSSLPGPSFPGRRSKIGRGAGFKTSPGGPICCPGTPAVSSSAHGPVPFTMQFPITEYSNNPYLQIL